MTSKLVVNTIEADTGISSVSFASSISMSSTSKFHFSDAGIDIGADTNISRAGNGILAFNINSSEKVRIDSSGSLLIGGTSSSGATEKLRIENDSATSDVCQVTIISGNAERAVLNFGDAQDHNIGRVTYDNSDNHISLWTDNTERLRIDSNGNMGLGTNSLVGNAANVYLTVNGSTLGGIALKANGTTQGTLTGSGGEITLSSDGTKPITFDTNGSERFKITTDSVIATSNIGHVLLGTETARSLNTHQARLQVTGTTYSHSTISVINNEASGNGSYLFLGKQRSGAVGGSTAVQANDIIGELRFPAGDGTDMENYAARIIVHADQNASSNNTSGYLDLHTTRRNGSSHLKARIHQNSSHGTQFSFGTNTSDLSNTNTGDRTSLKVGPATHIEGVFGHNGTSGMYYNCYSGGNDNFYRGTRAPSGGDWRPAAYGQKYGAHYFYGDNSTTAWNAQQQITSMQTNMRITNQGYVLKPKNPVFDAVRTSGSLSGNGLEIVFNSTLTNVGGHYNTSNGRFTAPIAGTYFFSMFGMYNGGLAWYNFRKNGITITPAHGTYQTNGSDWSSVGMSICITLAANDTLSVFLAPTNTGIYGSGNNHNGFCGYLIG